MVEHSGEMNDFERGQHDRFLRLYVGIEQALRVFARSLLFSREEERDVMQEVAVVLWRKFDPEMNEADFSRWAFGVARMEALAYRRDRARDRHLFKEDVSGLIAETLLEHAGTLEGERRALDGCIQKLPEGQRQLLAKAYAPNVKISELAGRLGQTAMSVYKTLHRIRLALTNCTQKTLAAEERS